MRDGEGVRSKDLFTQANYCRKFSPANIYACRFQTWHSCFFFILQLTELYTLLNENYVEDDDNMFRFDYSPEFLCW